MEKDIIIYKIYLLILFVAYLATILFNVDMFTFNRIISFIYGIGYCILALLCLWNFFMMRSNSKKGFWMGLILGCVVFIYSILECFLPGGFILKHLRIINIVYPVFGILLVLTGFNVLFVSKEEKKDDDKYNHRFGHGISQKKEQREEKKISKKLDGILVDGYIKDVLFNEDTNDYSLEIEYLYEGEKFIFYYEGISFDVSDILNKKKLRRIKVYLPDDNPEYAQIDEELLMYMINS